MFVNREQGKKEIFIQTNKCKQNWCLIKGNYLTTTLSKQAFSFLTFLI